MTLEELKQVKKDTEQGIMVSKSTWAKLLNASISAHALLRNFVAHADEHGLQSGVCCCGDSMDRHSSPMDCGHSPVDSGEYYMQNTLDKSRELVGEK